MATSITQTFSKLSYRNILKALARQRTRAVVNPFHPKPKIKSAKQHISVYNYTASQITHFNPEQIEETFQFRDDLHAVTWINLDNVNQHSIEALCNHYRIHWLIQEDIVSFGQRPKVDEIEGVLFVLLNLLYFNPDDGLIEHEQISIVLGKNFVISFQEDAAKDVFDPVRKRLQISNSKERERTADFLFYTLIDVIADSYQGVIENIGNIIEEIEEMLIVRATPTSFQKISQIRKDIILLKRNIAPVRDLVGALTRSNSELLEDKTTKYFKDVYDHVALANDLIDNYRDMTASLQEMYVNSVNLRMNEVMKTLAIVTAIMAPATVIGGIFGMNFETIPMSKNPWGFYITLAVMTIIPLLMILWFYNRGWFQKDYPSK